MLSNTINWNIINLKTIDDCVKLHIRKGNEAVSTDIEDFVDAENTLYILPENDSDPDNPAPCEIQLKTQNSHLIKSVHIVSNTKVVEICRAQGPLSEYFGTFVGELIDESEDISSFKLFIEFPQAVNAITLKFLQKSELWIFGIQVQVIETSHNPGIPFLPRSTIKNSINLENVRGMLENVILSEKAQKCKEFIESRESGNNTSAPPTLDAVMSMISKNLPTAAQQEEQVVNDNTKKYIDTQLEQFEHRLLEKMTEVEVRQNEKLDKILEYLEMSSK